MADLLRTNALALVKTSFIKSGANMLKNAVVSWHFLNFCLEHCGQYFAKR